MSVPAREGLTPLQRLKALRDVHLEMKRRAEERKEKRRRKEKSEAFKDHKDKVTALQMSLNSTNVDKAKENFPNVFGEMDDETLEKLRNDVFTGSTDNGLRIHFNSVDSDDDDSKDVKPKKLVNIKKKKKKSIEDKPQKERLERKRDKSDSKIISVSEPKKSKSKKLPFVEQEEE